MSEFIANLEHKTKKYPCMICFVKACCSELCELLSEDKHTMYESLENNICPDCSSLLLDFSLFNALKKVKCLDCEHAFYVDSACRLVIIRSLK